MRDRSWLYSSTMHNGISRDGRMSANDLRADCQHRYASTTKKISRPARYRNAYTVRTPGCTPSSLAKHVAKPQQIASTGTGSRALRRKFSDGTAGLFMKCSLAAGRQSSLRSLLSKYQGTDITARSGNIYKSCCCVCIPTTVPSLWRHTTRHNESALDS